MVAGRRPKLAVFKFASCDGCQLSLLNCEDELLAIAGEVEIANFLEASRAVVKGPYDLALVEGSITTPHDAERIHKVRRMSRTLVTIGACATAGGIQALRNFKDVREFTSCVYASPEYISTLEASTPIAQHVRVDLELRGCPISRAQLLELLAAFLRGRRPNIPTYSVCFECKRRGTVCVMAAHGTPCLGSGHPGRLRGAVSVVPPGLLRLLRADGVPQHRLPRRSLGIDGDGTPRPRPGLPDLQRRRGPVPCRE